MVHGDSNTASVLSGTKRHARQCSRVEDPEKKEKKKKLQLPYS